MHNSDSTTTRLSECVVQLCQAALGATGDELIAKLLEGLRRSLAVDRVFIAEPTGSGTVQVRLQASSAAVVTPVEFDLAGTAGEAALCCSDAMLPAEACAAILASPVGDAFSLGACLGAPIVGSTGGPRAVLIAGHREAFAEPELVAIVLRLSALHIAAELEREFGERRLRQHHRMESLGMLASSVAHDFNNKLTAILANVSLARMQLETAPSPGVAELLTEIETAGKQASDLTKQLMAFAGRTRKPRGPLDFGAVVTETCKLMEPLLPGGVAIQVSCASEPVLVNGEVTQLRQVVLNLLRNAADSMLGRHGAILVRVAITAGQSSLRHTTSVHAPGFAPERAHATLAVSDCGCGMNADLQHRLFSPLVTTKGKGQGFGLALCARIISRHDGAIAVESTPGVGTTVTVQLPALAAHAAGNSEPFAGARVLIADDEPVVRETMARTLRKLGCTVTLASDGTSALHILRTQQPPLQCAILDLYMPHLGGDAIAAMVHNDHLAVPIVLSSGLLPDNLSDLLRSGTIAAALQKPCTAMEVAAALRAALPAQSAASH